MKWTQSGLTLLELVMGVSVMAVVLAIAAPSFRQITESNRFAGTSHELTVSLTTARTLAISRGHRVSVCPMTHDQRCTGSNDWSQGWMVFLDAERTGQPKDATAILQVVQRQSGAAFPRVATTPGRHLVRYSPDGMAGGSNLTLSICAGHQDRLLGQVVVAVSGRTRSTRQPARGETTCPVGPPPA